MVTNMHDGTADDFQNYLNPTKKEPTRNRIGS